MPVDLVQKVLAADNLPSLSIVALEVLKLTRKDDVSVDELAKVVQNDPALTARILKVVNSSLFGVPREVGSIRQAIVILGLRTVKAMVLSFVLVDTLRKAADTGLDLADYWRRSLTTAVAARLLGKVTIARRAEEAFVAGLLSDLGLLAAWRCAPEAYAPAFSAVRQSGERLCDIESRTLGITHADLSRELLKNWNLPETVCAAVGAHHGAGIDRLTGDSLAMAKVVRSAAAVADIFCGDRPAAELAAVKSQCAKDAGMDDASLDSALAALDGYVTETASLLALEIGATMNYAQIQMDAAVQLANVGMEAEMDRAAASRAEREARDETTRLQQERKAILEIASTDGLTKIANRAAFDKRLNEEIERATVSGNPLGLILLDVDHFKKFNDAHGHQAGDEVLREVAACLREVASRAGLVARYGGEEFAVICLDSAADQSRELAEEIRRSIELQVVNYDGKPLRVTASLGVSASEPRGQPMAAKEMIESADRQLYVAKKNGRNRVEAGA